MNNDLIYRQAAIDALAKFVPYVIDDDVARAYTDGLTDAYNMICQLPSVHQTLYGYKIEHLAYIARVMEKEGVTAEYAAKTFGDISRAVRMIIEEAQQKAEEMLNEQFNQQIGSH